MGICNTDEEIISMEDLQMIFPQPFHLIYNFNQDFHDELEQRLEDWDIKEKIGDLFLKLV